MRQGPCLSAN